MYQLGTKWKLWDLESVFQSDIDSITLRGDKQDSPITLPADFFNSPTRLSVEKIASRYCPTRRDMYFQLKLGKKLKRENKTWGQTAGPVIEKYCVGILGHFTELAKAPDGLNYETIHGLAKEYTQKFWSEHTTELNKLKERASDESENPARLSFLLQQTAKYELSLLGADYAFSMNSGQEFVPLAKSIPIKFDPASLAINPDEHLGLGSLTTPDFIIMSPVPVMGDVKSGPTLQSFHLTTITGYAMAYESQNKVPVNFGIIYFFNTRSKEMNFAQSYVFVIDDTLRKQFISARNDLYALLQKEELPPVADPSEYEKYCKYCRYHADCYAKP
jgi:CRISPR/Cas system-associated exonuclease Cas4 (RecB family)